MLRHLPQQTTRLLIRLCTGTLPPAVSALPPPLPLRPTSPTSSIRNTANALQALSLLPFAGGPTEDAASAKQQTFTAAAKRLEKPGKHTFESYAPPSAQTFMPAFVDHPDNLIQFLEEIYEQRTFASREKITTSEVASVKSYPVKEEPVVEPSARDIEEQKVLWTALLELYLMDERPIDTSLDVSDSPTVEITAPPTDGDDLSDAEIARRRALRSKALSLLKDQTVDYDANQALVLCHLKQFDEGVVYLYQKMEMYSDIIRFWMEKEETDKVIECARKYG